MGARQDKLHTQKDHTMKVMMTEPLQPVGIAVFEDHPDIELIRPEDTSEEALIEAARGVDGIAVRSAKLTANVLAATPTP